MHVFVTFVFNEMTSCTIPCDLDHITSKRSMCEPVADHVVAMLVAVTAGGGDALAVGASLQQRYK